MAAVTRTVVHLLRHGKVQNPEGILYGLLPGFHLASSGRAMAEAVAGHLADHDISHLVASSLTRAQETAAPISARFDLPIVTDDRVIEATNQFQGRRMTGKDGALVQPSNWLKLRDPATPSWGEPYLVIAHRMLAGVYAAEAAARGREAVIVSHQLPIWTIRRYLEGKRLWHNPAIRQCNVASLTSLTFEDGVFTRAHYSEPAGHIPAVNDGPGAAA
ncbi:histidine phosphatase family protein [Nakamurella silvestris]|nr:histidine phosphatase family protein [Nakamurella silvestris]